MQTQCEDSVKQPNHDIKNTITTWKIQRAIRDLGKVNPQRKRQHTNRCFIKNLKGSFKSSNIPQELAANVNSEGELEILTNFTHGDAIPRQKQTNLEESFNKRKAVQRPPT